MNGTLVSEFDGAIWFDLNQANAFFSINTGFVSGLNTLTFLVENTAGPGGTLIQNLSGTVRPSGVPEAASSMLLMGIALGALGLIRSRLT